MASILVRDHCRELRRSASALTDCRSEPLRLVVGTVDEALSPLRWEVARTGTELLILLTPAAPMTWMQQQK